MATQIIDLGNHYIHAEQIEDIKGKPAYAIVGKTEIACVAYYPLWRRYVMLTDGPAAFDIGCMESIIKFIGGLK